MKVAGKALGALALTEKLTEGVMEMTDKPDVQEDDMITTGPPTIVEEIEVEARNLIKRVQELIREGNIRTLRVKDKNGKYLLEIPLTVGVVAGGAFALAAPWAVALSALAGFLVDVKIEIVREGEAGEDDGPTGAE
jgi:hypothetical protein